MAYDAAGYNNNKKILNKKTSSINIVIGFIGRRWRITCSILYGIV